MADTTEDQVATLGKWVETQSLGDTHDGDSTAHLVQELGGQIGDVSISMSRAGVGTFKESLEKSGVQMPNRKTPYEVWADKQRAPAKKVSVRKGGRGERVGGSPAMTVSQVRGLILCV